MISFQLGENQLRKSTSEKRNPESLERIEEKLEKLKIKAKK